MSVPTAGDAPPLPPIAEKRRREPPRKGKNPFCRFDADYVIHDGKQYLHVVAHPQPGYVIASLDYLRPLDENGHLIADAKVTPQIRFRRTRKVGRPSTAIKRAEAEALSPVTAGPVFEIDTTPEQPENEEGTE